MKWLTVLGCLLMRHPRKRISYWMVKAAPDGPIVSGSHERFSGPRADSSEEGDAFAYITFECPDCKRRWSTELS